MSAIKIQPPFFKPGDEVAYISPAFSIEEAKVKNAAVFLKKWGLKLHIGKNALVAGGLNEMNETKIP
jgi:muramoyltetrapeptide carboxypeptidase LdcA involved in peptidoglycan recycling